MNVLIVDDDVKFSHRLKDELNSIMTVEKINIINDGYDEIDYTGYDYVFMDIMLGNQNGIEIANHIHGQHKIIFISSNESLVYDCFRIHLYYFIRKEYYKQDLIKLLEKIKQDQVSQSIQLKDCQISYNDIIYIESQKNKCVFHTKEKIYEHYTTLKSLEQNIDDTMFYRVNSYTIINFQYVEHINSRQVVLKNNSEFNISRKSKDLIEKYHLYRSQSSW